MSEAGKNLEGRIVDGKFPLLRCVGESDHSMVFVTERKGDALPAAIKLLPAVACDPETTLSFWETAAKLSHPHLIRLFESGRCQIGSEQYCYAVMEYAEENLYQILPDRPLSSEEAEQMLPSVLAALDYLHKQGFVHGHVKPSNILAVADQVKLSSDGIIRTGQKNNRSGGQSLYEAPEVANTPASPSWDVWSLGVTLVEALTQHPPSSRDVSAAVLPQSLAAPFSEIVRNCLRPQPQQRWSLDKISAKLKPPSTPTTKSAVEPPREGRIEAAEFAKKPTLAKPGILIATSALAVILLALFFVKIMHHAPVNQNLPTAAAAPTLPPADQTPVPAVPPAISPPVASETPATPATAAPGPASEAPKAEVPVPAAEAAHPNGSGILHKVLPEVPRSASRTIHGTIRVKVKVNVEPSGQVSSANITSPGSSAYFARLALQSARKWTFAPGEGDGHPASSIRILVFEFRQSGVRANAGPSN